MRRILSMLIVAVIAVVTLGACSASTKTYGSDCAFIVGNGIGDTRQVKDVVHPGEKSHLKGDDEDFFVPCNARNFLITHRSEHGDRHSPSEGITAPGNGVPGTPVKAWMRMYWTLNQNDNVMKEFYNFCRKYACASRTHDGGEDTSNFATVGWTGMLQENHSQIIDQAFRQAVADAPADAWHNQGDWPTIANRMSDYFMTAMRTADGSADNFFCGAWTADPKTDAHGTCTPVRFVITDMQPQDPQIAQAYNTNIKAQLDNANAIADVRRQEQLVQAQKQLARQRSKLFTIPGYQQQLAQQYLLDAIKACGDAGLTVCPNTTGASVVVSGR